ncbi:M18 family aminopeptidase [Gammaproteobacteria bacterium AS21]
MTSNDRNTTHSLKVQQAAVIKQLISFIQAAVTPFHAVQEMARQLEQVGFLYLDEKCAWHVKPAGKYYTTRNGSSIVAWQMPADKPLESSGFRMVGAHTDSPCLKVKPNPDIVSKGYLQLGVQVYGGVLLAPWFDRDLSLAGRVSFLDDDDKVVSRLVNFDKAIAIIPSLAIHLNREANSGMDINAQTMVTPIIGQLKNWQTDNKEPILLKDILKDKLLSDDVAVKQVLDFDLSFYDVQAPASIGFHDELFASARLDNLLSCFMGLQALLNSDSQHGVLFVSNDHEEVGSASAAGAQGPMLEQVLKRLTSTNEQFDIMIANSMMISADNAHGVHPNFVDKHDANHGPILNAGPVIKVNANQRYASNDITSAMFKQFAAKVNVPVQSFVVRADMACGSTIGPITATELGVKTLDIGVPQFAMHSIREQAGCSDIVNTIKVLKHYFNEEHV